MTIYPGGPQDNIMYTMTSPDGVVATFNNSSDANYCGQLHVTGLDSPDIREAIDDRAGTDGALQGLNFRGRRAVTLNIELLSASTSARNTAFQKIKRAANALRLDGTLDFTPDGGSPGQRVYFRLNGPIRRADPAGWKYDIMVPLMAADPYIYSQAQRTLTVNATPWSGTATNQGDGQASLQTAVSLNAAGTLQLFNSTSGQRITMNSIDPATIVTYNSKFGAVGTGNGQFSNPSGVAVDGSGNIYVTDYSNHRVQKFNSSGVYQAQVGGFGTGNGQFNGPYGITCDSANNVFVADFGNHRIQKFNSSLVYQSQLGAFGTGNGQFKYPAGLATHSTGTDIFVVDTGNYRVQRVTNASPPVYTTQIGSQGTGNGQFGTMNDCAVDSTGNLYVGDVTVSGANTIQKFTNAAPPVFTSRTTLNTGGSLVGVEIDNSNNIYVSDVTAMTIKKYNSSFVLQTTIGGFGTADGLLNRPWYMAHTAGLLYVADVTNNRIQAYNIGTTQVVTLDHGRTTVTASGLNLYSYIDVPNTTWWSLNPGDNAVQVVGPGVTTYTMTWRDAWL